MRTILRVLLWGLGLLVVFLLGVFAWALLRSPTQGEPFAGTVETSPEIVARGKYLVDHVAACGYCHSEADNRYYGLPPKPDRYLAGGFCFDAKYTGIEGLHVCSPNITQDKETGIGAWTDGEIARAIREGVTRDNRALSGMMPFMHFRELADSDLRAIVAYLRTVPAVSNKVPERKLPWWMDTLNKMTTGPGEGAPPATPPAAGTPEHGKYLVVAAACERCHTPVGDMHIPVEGMEFSGGQELPLPNGGVVRSANISPHKTGLGDRTREAFVAQFKAYDNEAARKIEVPAERNTYMPWVYFAGMTEADLGAIYGYLKTVPAIDRTVEKYPAAPAATH